MQYEVDKLVWSSETLRTVPQPLDEELEVARLWVKEGSLTNGHCILRLELRAELPEGTCRKWKESDVLEVTLHLKDIGGLVRGQAKVEGINSREHQGIGECAAIFTVAPSNQDTPEYPAFGAHG